MKIKVSVIIPTLNEAGHIKKLVSKILKKYVDEIIIVDGNSKDGTFEKAKETRAIVIKQKGKGYGNAIQQGAKLAKGKVLILMDADGSHDPKYIPKLLKEIDKGYEYIMGSRYAKGAKSFDNTPIRDLGNRFFTFLTNLLFKTNVTDSIYTYNAIPKNIFNKIKAKSPGFEYCTELLVKARALNLKFSEIPTNEKARMSGQSKVNPLVDGIKYLKIIFSLYLEKLQSHKKNNNKTVKRKRTNKNFFSIILLVALTIISWFPVFKQTFQGEGFIYFELPFNFFPFYKGRMWEPDIFARIQFDFFQITLRDKILYYQIYMVFVVILVGIFFYFLLKNITKNRISSFMASILFVCNYTGFFELLGNGGYQRFVQRIPNIIFTSYSLLMLNKFLDEKKYKYLLTSIFVFTLGVWGAHYSTFFLPVFILLPILKVIFSGNNKRVRNYITSFIISSSYLLINLYIINKDPSTPDVGFLDFFFKSEKLFEKIFIQLPITTFQVNLIDFLNKTIPSLYQSPPIKLLDILILPSLLIFLSGGYIIYKKECKLFPVYTSSFLSMFSAFILNIWAAPFRPLESFGTDRYYMVPMFFSSICMALIFFVTYKHNKKTFYVIFSIFLVLYIINTITIHRKINESYYKHLAMKAYIDYVKNNELGLKENDILYARRFYLWSTIYIRTFYKYLPYINFQELHNGWEKDMVTKKFDPNRVHIIDYDFGGARGSKFDESRGKIVDYTDQFRKGKKMIFEWY